MTCRCQIDSLWQPPTAGAIVTAGQAERHAWQDAIGSEIVLDSMENAMCAFIRVPAEAGDSICLTLAGGGRLDGCASGGWLVRANDSHTYWIPAAPRLRRLDAQGHICEESDAEFIGLSATPGELAATLRLVPGFVLDWQVWRFATAANARDLEALSRIETQGYFSWGSHTRYLLPADVYAHLIHGWVYERRYAWPFNRKICSENDAHALHVTLTGLRTATGKRLYRLLADQILLATLARQSTDGAWRHGEWTEGMEAHYRLNTSALHLCMDAWCESPDQVVGEALRRAGTFLSAQRDQVAGGTWFLHDELEHDPAKLNQGPFRWLESRAFGKSASNMLVLNTQLDTTVALDRMQQLTGIGDLAAQLKSARQATQAVLAARPAEWLYRPLFAAIRLTLLPTKQAASLPLPLRALKRLAWRYLIPRLPDIKVRFPRLVMPGGYVDRELCVRTWAHHYLTINLMDLARHHRRFPEAATEQVIREAIRFAAGSGIVERWKELNYEKYALGFWAEALYHVCRLFPGEKAYRGHLAEAMVNLADLGLGLPPSLLGANAEAVPCQQQTPCPQPPHAGLLIAHLGDVTRPEVLLVNPGEQPIGILPEDLPAGLVWRLLDGSVTGRGAALPARGAWLGTPA